MEMNAVVDKSNIMHDLVLQINVRGIEYGTYYCVLNNIVRKNCKLFYVDLEIY